MKVNDTPDIKNPENLTPREVNAWRKEQMLKAEIKKLQKEHTKMIKKWSKDKDNKELIKKANKLQCKILLKQESLTNL